MSKNFDQLPAADALGGTETLPVNQAGATKYTTINAIITFLGSAFDAVGTATAAIVAHLAAYDHTKIAHTNRTALDLVSGTNTGDQDLSGYLSNTENISTTKNVLVGTNTLAGGWPTGTTGVLQIGGSGVGDWRMFMAAGVSLYNCYIDDLSDFRMDENGYSMAHLFNKSTGAYVFNVGGYALKDASATTLLPVYSIDSAGSFLIQNSYTMYFGGTSGNTSGINLGPYSQSTIQAGALLTSDEDILFTTGKGLKMQGSAANSRIGTATLVAGTVTINNNTITANTRIFLTVSTAGGTQGFLSTTRVNGTSFTINSTNAADTSIVQWLLVEQY